jgi:hypothetical protein
LSENTGAKLRMPMVNPQPMTEKLMKNGRMNLQEALQETGETYISNLRTAYGGEYHFAVQLSSDGQRLQALQGRLVVEKVINEKSEIAIEHARLCTPDIQVGETVYRSLPPIAFEGFPVSHDELQICNLKAYAKKK